LCETVARRLLSETFASAQMAVFWRSQATSKLDEDKLSRLIKTEFDL
jgi:hypothetical protein